MQAVVSFAAPKPLKQAEKLAGDYAKIAEARAKIAEALADSSLRSKAHTYYVAGKVEEGAFRHFYKLLAINRNDPNVDRTQMADALLSARDYYEKALTLDTVTDKKGRRHTTYSDRIAAWLNLVTPSLYNAGVAYMNKRMYYPQAYNAFTAYALVPTRYYYHPTTEAQSLNDSVQANAWYYAGVMAYNAEKYETAAEAFVKSRKLGYKRKEVILNEMSCLGKMAAADSTLNDSMSHRITRLAARGHELHGLSTPLFIKKYVAGLVYEQKPDSALRVVDASLAVAPDMPLLHALKAALLSAAGDIPGSAAEYRLAAASPDADFTTLLEAAKTITREGLSLLDEVHGVGRNAAKRRKEIKEKHLRQALEFAERALEMRKDDTDAANTVEAIRYYML